MSFFSSSPLLNATINSPAPRLHVGSGTLNNVSRASQDSIINSTARTDPSPISLWDGVRLQVPRIPIHAVHETLTTSERAQSIHDFSSSETKGQDLPMRNMRNDLLLLSHMPKQMQSTREANQRPHLLPVSASPHSAPPPFVSTSIHLRRLQTDSQRSHRPRHEGVEHIVLVSNPPQSTLQSLVHPHHRGAECSKPNGILSKHLAQQSRHTTPSFLSAAPSSSSSSLSAPTS